MSFPLKNLVGNHKSARPIVYEGVRYPSRRVLAAALGISVVTLRRRLRERTPLESPTKVPLELLSERPKEPELTVRKHRGVVYKGVAYDTIYDCAAEFDLTPFTVRYRLKHGIPLEAPPLLPKGYRHRWQGMVLTKGNCGSLRRVHKNNLAPPEGGQGYQP